MSLKLRPSYASVTPYRPGRRPNSADVPVARLASNECSLPPYDEVLAAVAEAAATSNRYPDNTVGPLREAFAALAGVDVDQVVVGPGSVALCQLLIQATAGPGDEVLMAWRSFEAYPQLTALAGAVPVQVPLLDGVHDLPGMAAGVTDRTRLVFVCNPNNPTGTTVPTAAVKAFLRSVPADVVVVYDEAYREYVRDETVLDGVALIAEFPNVVVLRTLSKAHALAGLRVGYLLCRPELAGILRAAQVPFAVSSLAQAAALASLAQTGQTDARAADVVAERGRVLAGVRAAVGVPVPEPQGNFVWLPLGDATTEVADRLAAAHVLVRPFAGEGLRVSIGAAWENDAFLAALPGALLPAGDVHAHDVHAQTDAFQPHAEAAGV